MCNQQNHLTHGFESEMQLSFLYLNINFELDILIMHQGCCGALGLEELLHNKCHLVNTIEVKRTEHSFRFIMNIFELLKKIST